MCVIRRPRSGQRHKLNAQLMAKRVGLSPALTIDAAWPASVGSGQTLTDLSGNSRDFVLGAAVGVSTDDPTLVAGAPLTRSRYLSFDGGDYLTKATANDAFFNGLHKDDAAWSIVVAIYVPATNSAASRILATKAAAGSDVGIMWTLNGNETVCILQSDGVANFTLGSGSDKADLDAWNVIGVSQDEAGGATGSFIYMNGTVETYDGAYTTPSASDAGTPATIGADGAAGGVFIADVRLGAFMMFASAITQAQMASLGAAMSARYGI